ELGGTDRGRKLAFASGPRFKPRGEKSGKWDDLELVVTPEEVTARWNGQPFTVTTSDIQRKFDMDMKVFPPAPGSPVKRENIPQFDARGGLGLYVYRASASFRQVTVTPISVDHPVP